MPELPEVEVLRSQIQRHVVGARINKVSGSKYPRFSSAADASGAVVSAVNRRGKYLLLSISGSRELVIHLGMSGQLLWVPVSGTAPVFSVIDISAVSHVHVGFHFDAGTLWFRDPRRFGRIAVVPAGVYTDFPTLSALGPEYTDPLFNVARVVQFLTPFGSTVKARLLEQRMVAGVGNYIADETLWRAQVHPAARAVSKPACSVIYQSLCDIIGESLTAGGASERDYVHIDGSRGMYASHLQVYGRAGLPCSICSTPISHGRVAGRGTSWCPQCQKM